VEPPEVLCARGQVEDQKAPARVVRGKAGRDVREGAVGRRERPVDGGFAIERGDPVGARPDLDEVRGARRALDAKVAMPAESLPDDDVAVEDGSRRKEAPADVSTRGLAGRDRLDRQV
jgi:hypothetical protein